MKISLTARLIAIMVLSIFLSSLISILFVSFTTVRQIRGINLKRDMNISLLVAESLSTAAGKGELYEAIADLSSRRSRGSMAEGRMGQGMMRTPRMSEQSPFRQIFQGESLVMDVQGTAVPILITDHRGTILLGQYRRDMYNPDKPLSSEIIEQGAAFYLNGAVAGYVLAGNLAGQNERGEDLSQISSTVKTVLMYPILSALLASLLGVFLLRRALSPLKSLHKGVQTLQKGEYSYRVSIPRSKIAVRDELTRLSEGFNDMAESLEASEEWKKQIISDTAHELRTPVSLIMGNLEMILDGVYKADKSRLESIYKESTVLADLIKNLQVLASEESKKNSTERNEFSLSELVLHTADDFRALALQKNISILPETLQDMRLTADLNKTRQVLKNLITNALKFTPENGTIRLRCYIQKPYIIVEIEDSGPGIPPEYREKIFNRFFKIDTSRNSEGSGLGLSISRVIIENQGGTLSAHEGREGGALFRISFPLNDLS